MLNEFGDAAGEAEFGGLFRALVGERDFQTFVEKGVFAEARGERVVAEYGFFENRGIGMEGDLGAGLAGLAGLLELGGGLALFVGLLPDGAVALNFEFEKVGESVDDGDADAMETAGNFVGVTIEFSAGVENGEDDFGGRALFGGVHVHGNAAAVVHDGDGVVRVDGDVHFIGEARHGFVDGIVHDFPNEMVKAHFAGRADVHGGAQADGFQAAENLNGLRVILVAALAGYCFLVAHLISLAPDPPCG